METMEDKLKAAYAAWVLSKDDPAIPYRERENIWLAYCDARDKFLGGATVIPRSSLDFEGNAN